MTIMADEGQKRLLELQMEELREMYGIEIDEEERRKSKSNNDRSENNAKIAKLYEDVAEYKVELARFEDELAVIKSHDVEDVVSALTEAFPDKEGSYEMELKAVLEAHWKHFVEVEGYPKEQLAIIQGSAFVDIVRGLCDVSPEYDGDFKRDIADILVKRWEMLISVKKEHIQEEFQDMKISGLKPDYVERVYKRYHGIV